MSDEKVEYVPKRNKLGEFSEDHDEVKPAAGRGLTAGPKSGNAGVSARAGALVLEAYPTAQKFEIGWRSWDDDSAPEVMSILGPGNTVISDDPDDFRVINDILIDLEGANMRGSSSWEKLSNEQWMFTIKQPKPVPAEPLRPPLTDQQRFTNKLRGHNFMPPKAELKKIPPIGTYTETPLDEIPIQQHYFSRSGAGNWYVAEYDPKSGTAWGYADLTGSTGEWGQFDMVELEQLHVGWTVIERDCHFGSPRNMGTIRSLGY
jgi:hypothetical protein